LDIIGSQVRIEIEAPKDTVIVRKELKPLEQKHG
jgi:sRNA-binding carbon storage regulator CsrA